MVKLEEKIVKKVYEYEGKRTFIEVAWKMLSVVIIGGLWFFFGFALIEILKRQQTLDILELFAEDREVIKIYWKDILEVFSYEIPRELAIPFVLFLGIFILLILLFLKNFGKMRRRVQSILEYSSRKR
jgi:hypothetical protein